MLFSTAADFWFTWLTTVTFIVDVCFLIILYSVLCVFRQVVYSLYVSEKIAGLLEKSESAVNHSDNSEGDIAQAQDKVQLE